MPAVSKKQQRFFGLVHAYQSGKLPASKASPAVKRVAKTISNADAKKYASTPHKNITEKLKEILRSPKYIEETINDMVESNSSGKIRGEVVDAYTAQMLKVVLARLTEENKNLFLSKPLNEMVAISYKILLY